ncbi:SCO4225 family membrane protein [Nonomuraea zeae]|uniref:Uncharacterized protein n=1 Tax=Nonomuraea zeae TaxID=1642303 RepID=A0A5S4H2N5_9ACTN|nr:hypothetical protein [Nonomuraea zeae]TMR39397.1 hypothetical protein ETD85_01750 [Nonomuraea zeae]
MRRYRNGRNAAVIAGAYGGLVLLLGVVSLVIVLTAPDPILLTGLALVVVTFPLGWLVWWGRDLVPALAGRPVLFTVLLVVAGLLQTWVLWRATRGSARP